MSALRPLLLIFSLLAFVACNPGDSSNGDDEGSDPTDFSADEGGSSASNVSLPIVADEVINGDLVLTVNTTGQVRSESEGRIRSEVAGTVQEILVKPGDRVVKGQTVVVLDQRPFELDLEEAVVALSLAEQEYQDLYQSDSLVTGRAPSEARREAYAVRSGLASARVRHERAELQRERSSVTAPFTGVVDRVLTVPGDRLGSGQDVAVLVDMVNLRIEAAVLEHDLPLIRIGGDAAISSAAMPGQTVRGQITAILPLVDSTTRAGRAFVRARGNGALRPGMYADVRLEAQRLPSRILVPTRAIIQRDGRDLVFVVRDGRAQWTYIQVGRSNGRETEVLPDSSSGMIPVSPGDLVIIEGHLTLTHDAPVRVVAQRERDPGSQD